ncbi:hypothetical protein KU406_23770, partial [Salmonella enterica subsp. enterica serovar Montevideo]|nr:hypothetical protein [Salmonella enterica subsp. enterica serovar Montevideo]
RLVAAVQKLLTLIATGLLPVVSLLALLFIVTLPFTGLEAISAAIIICSMRWISRRSVTTPLLPIHRFINRLSVDNIIA